MREFALLGPTASGKTKLALNLANKLNGVILSLDSLSIYKSIDIASAKPTKKERGGIKHFGIDIINPDENFNVTLFFKLYHEAKKYCENNAKTLIIVGGTSFYLKAMLSGLSDKPVLSEEVKQQISKRLKNLDDVYEQICQIDQDFANKITNKDAYRMEKWLSIYLASKQIPSQYLKQTLQEPVIKNIPIYELAIDKEKLTKKITLRTKQMIKLGLIDEVLNLEKKYGRAINPLKAIGLKEVLQYLDGHYNLQTLEEKIITNTNKLAKRQKTFNKTQFQNNIIKDEFKELYTQILNS